MIVVVDTNIVFSGILNPDGTISDLLLNSQNNFEYYSPSLILDELERHKEKLLKLSGYSISELNFLTISVLRKISIIDLEFIKPESWENAIKLTKNVDEFDTPFIALSIELEAPLWTGDKKLTNGLKMQGIDWVIDTDTLKHIRNKE